MNDNEKPKKILIQELKELRAKYVEPNNLNSYKHNRAKEFLLSAETAELVIANKELAFQNEEKEKRANELVIANKELAFQNEKKEKRAAELVIANKELAFQNEEKEKRAAELVIANKELAFQNEEKEKRAAELVIANKELAFQNEEKEKRAAELVIANKELAFQNEEKEKRAAELVIANKELTFQNEEKEKRANELVIANKELAFQNEKKEKRAAELVIANKELAFQNEEKEKRAAELVIANKELAFQNEEKEKRAAELVIANKELAFQNEEKEKRAAELVIANKELAFQNEEKEKRAAELVIANAYLDNLIGYANAPIIVWDPQYRITRFNQAFESLTGRCAHEVLGQSLDILFPPDQVERSMQLIRYAQSGKRLETDEIDILTVDGTVSTMLWNSATIIAPDGKTPTATIAQGQDITKRIQAEEELKKLHEHLEELVKERTSQLEASNRELEAFSYSVSHDLRSPLRAIDGFSRIVWEDYSPALDEEGKRLLNVIRTNTQKMAQLIDDLLSFSRTGRKEMTRGKINMESLVRSVIEALKESAGQRTIKVTVGSLPPAFGDAAMIRQVFVNLLSNAFKFTRNTERAVIQVEGRVENGENIYSVCDNGVGFDMEYQNKLFGIFQRLHGQEEFEGTGVGLAIVQRIIYRHGGRVWGEGTVNEGACFSFILPVKQREEKEYKNG